MPPTTPIAPVRADSDAHTPEGRRGIWARHAPASLWCFVVDIKASAITACRGAWPATDVVEWSAAPTHDERCDECERQRIAALPIERALAELRDAVAGMDHDTDLGGEGGIT